MVTAKTLTNTELQARLTAAREKERRARATTARLAREIADADRRRRAQVRICLGAALLRAVEREPRALDGLRRLLLPEITRPTDLVALNDTPFVPEAVGGVTDAAASEGGARDGGDGSD